MADETIINLPGAGFSSMSRDQLLELTRNPPQAEGGRGKDPLAGCFTPANVVSARAAGSLPIGSKAYHRGRKIEVTIQAASEKEGCVNVTFNNGEVHSVRMKNLTIL
jgi:hypothetical protein